MSKHTPGPWTLESDASECVVSRDPEANEFHIVARAYGPDEDANARLIAAAPDLLAACKALVEAGGNPTNLKLGTEQLQRFVSAWGDMRAAIAKAEGVS